MPRHMEFITITGEMLVCLIRAHFNIPSDAQYVDMRLSRPNFTCSEPSSLDILMESPQFYEVMEGNQVPRGTPPLLKRARRLKHD